MPCVSAYTGCLSGRMSLLKDMEDTFSAGRAFESPSNIIRDLSAQVRVRKLGRYTNYAALWQDVPTHPS